jgi:outer membrane protein assembly factor BamB
MRGRALAALVLVTLACLLSPPAGALDLHCSSSGPGGSWTSVGGSTDSARVQAQEHDVKVPLLALWTFDPLRSSHVAKQQFTGQPLVAGGCAYVASHQGTDSEGYDLPGWVYSLNTGYGEVVWQRQLEGGIRGSLALTPQLVLAHVQGRAGTTLVALDRRTGATRWSTHVASFRGARALASPVVVDNLVWVGVAGPRGVSALLDLSSGRILHSDPTASIDSAAAIDTRTDRAYVPTSRGVVAVDLDPSRSTFGHVVARGPQIATSSTPNLLDGRVVSFGDDGMLRMLRKTDLVGLAQVLVSGPGESGSTAAFGTTVYGSAQTPGALWAVDLTTGTVRWITPLADGNRQLTPVSLANGIVYTVDLVGDLVAADAGTGIVLWRLPMAVGSETYASQTLSSAGVTIAEHLILTASGQRDTADQNGFVVAYGPARLPV